MTYMLLLNCALKLVEEIIKYFIVSTCELFASEKLVLRNTGLSEFG